MQHLYQGKVLVCGDVMLDRYWLGDTKRISPEAPVPVVKVNQDDIRPGGAGNVAINITALGGQSVLCGVVGEDEYANIFSKTMADHEVVCDLTRSKTHPTVTKLRVLSQQQQLIRLDFEESFQKIDKTELEAQFTAHLKEVGAVVLSDYGKGTLSAPEKLIALANKANVPVLIDPKGSDFSRYKGATLITPNLKEFEAVVGDCSDEATLFSKAKKLVKEINLKAILVTRSEKGMSLVPAEGEPITLPTRAKEVFDVTGAGDTVIGVLALGLAAGYDVADAMVFANAAAGIVVGKIGTATASIEELNNELHRVLPVPTGIVDELEVIKAMEIAHMQGEKVVMTNGCFDLVHSGHVDYLKAAKKLGDRLIVAVNDDASVTRLKGKTRPLVSLEHRMQVLSALECVDWVVAFSEDTPQRIISTLLPDILVKGADYQVDEIAGAKEVTANGGEVKTITLTPGCSTTNIVNKILESGA